MTNLQIATSTVIDGIEFYISEDGKMSGCSVSGIARMCGVSQQNISRLLRSIADTTKTLPKSLESLRGKALTLQVTTGNRALVIDSEVASVIITHYALNPKTDNKVAKTFLMKFAAQGLHGFIKQVTGYNDLDEQPQLNMLELCKAYIAAEEKITTLQPKADAYDEIEKIVADRQGLKNIISTPVEEDNRTFTLAEYLSERQITLDKGVMVNFSRAVSDSYKIHNGEKPATITTEYFVRGIRRVGTTNIYQSKDVPVIREAMKYFGII